MQSSLQLPDLAGQGRTTPHPSLALVHRRPLFPQQPPLAALFTNLAKLGLETILGLDVVFFFFSPLFCEQKVSVSFPKNVYNIPFE